MIDQIESIGVKVASRTDRNRSLERGISILRAFRPGADLLGNGDLAERTVSTVRNISLMLRPSLLDDLWLEAALQWQVGNFSERSGIDAQLIAVDVEENLPDDVKTCIYRITQEALNNCEKYASAQTVQVSLAQRP